MSDKKSRSDIETVLNDHSALQHLKTLVDAGCNRSELLSLLDLAFFANESWDTLVGRDLRAFKGAIAQIRACASVIEGLNRSELVYHVTIEIGDPRFLRLNELPDLSERLREYAGSLDLLRVMYGPKSAIRRHAWKAWIVARVMEDTKRPHDREVASLIAVVLGEAEYSEKAHQAWRLDHRGLIEKMHEKLLQRRRKRIAFRSPN